ncbi:hypothetical protein COCNU_06G001170 [Cocos nucifera]|uniref:Uncharacterized protein n=1 Tax=Cocos nucifera TaxID=13894 RepID=A0A8K0I9I1_COCNU|nr:hypothetical protein COCNU_06G001170 [Cocos nucifera]
MNFGGCCEVSETAQLQAGRQCGEPDFRELSSHSGVGELRNKENGSGVDRVGLMERGLEGKSGQEKIDGHAAIVTKLKVVLMEWGLDLGLRCLR